MTEEDWARTRATCSEFRGVSTEGIWEVIWASELMEDWLLELWPIEEVEKDLGGSGVENGVGLDGVLVTVSHWLIIFCLLIDFSLLIIRSS